MNQTVGDRGQGHGGVLGLETGLEALQTSPEFHVPVESLDGHHCNDHFAHIYESREQKFAAAVPFVRHGLEEGERVMYVVDESTDAEVRAAMRDAGLDVGRALSEGQLSFHTVQETYLRDGAFEPDEMVEFYAETVADVTDEYEGLRIVAETTWLQGDATTIEQFMEYESKVNDLFAGTDSHAICQYDRDGFSAETIRTVVETHPHLIYDGAVCHNVYYTPPGEFFGSEDPAREVDRMLGTLRERTEAKAELARHERFLRRLYEITASQDFAFEEKLDALFDLGCEQFDLDVGALNRVDPDADRLEVEYASGDHSHFEVGSELPLSETYCQAATDIEEAEDVTNPVEEGYDDVRVYEEFGVGGYLGTYVPVEGAADRTLAFVPDGSRDEAFSDQDRAYVELMGQWVGYELNRRQREQFVRECYEITADPGLAFDEKLHRLLAIARERFGLDAAGLTHLPETDGEFLTEYAIGYSDGDGVVGEADDVWTDPDEDCFCRQVVTADEPVGMADVRGTEWEDDEIHQKHGLSSYLGTKVMNGSTPYGALWVGSTEPRDREFSETERTFIKLIGQWVSYEVERRQRERELQERTEHLSALVETTPECIKQVDADGTLLQMNPAGLDMVEADAESDVVGESVYGLIAPEHRKRFREFNERVCQGEDGTLEFDIIGLDETRRHMETHAAPLRRSDDTTTQVALTRDVTEQKERERALRESKNQLQALIDVLPVAVFVAEANGEIVEWNEAAEAIWGGEIAESESVAEYDAYDGWWVDTGEPVEPDEWALARALRGEEVTDPDEIEIEGFDGVHRTVLNHGMPVRDADGEVSRAVVTLVDITERKQREAELRQSNDRLKQFAYAASHDLQEPLRMVSTYLQLLENEYADDLDETAGKYIDFAVDGADRMRAMVDDLLAFARVEQDDRSHERVDCDAVLDRVTDDLQLQIAENDATVVAQSLPAVMGDPEQLEQLFSNLVSNAIKYNESEEPRVEITADRRGGTWRFSVADNGIGIDPEATDRIFEVFNRLHHEDEYSGTGVGLALCQEIVENHGGEIRVDSEPGEGSTFSFTLQAARDRDR